MSDCGCDYELVEDGAVQRKRWFHEPDCPLGSAAIRCDQPPPPRPEKRKPKPPFAYCPACGLHVETFSYEDAELMKDHRRISDPDSGMPWCEGSGCVPR